LAACGGAREVPGGGGGSDLGRRVAGGVAQAGSSRVQAGGAYRRGEVACAQGCSVLGSIPWLLVLQRFTGGGPGEDAGFWGRGKGVTGVCARGRGSGRARWGMGRGGGVVCVSSGHRKGSQVYRLFIRVVVHSDVFAFHDGTHQLSTSTSPSPARRTSSRFSILGRRARDGYMAAAKGWRAELDRVLREGREKLDLEKYSLGTAEALEVAEKLRANRNNVKASPISLSFNHNSFTLLRFARSFSATAVGRCCGRPVSSFPSTP
jgi:hypothetical protein